MIKLFPKCFPSNMKDQSDATRFAKITDMKRSPTNDNAAARRASWEEQTVPRGAGVLGDMWNKYVKTEYNMKSPNSH